MLGFIHCYWLVIGRNQTKCFSTKSTNSLPKVVRMATSSHSFKYGFGKFIKGDYQWLIIIIKTTCSEAACPWISVAVAEMETSIALKFLLWAS